MLDFPRPTLCQAASAIALLALALGIAGCQAVDESELRRDHAELVGGSPTPADPSVVAVFAGGLCTGTVVAPRIVLTAAHCVSDAIEAGFTDFGRVQFGDGQGPWFDTIDIVDMTMHRLYAPPSFREHDIAMVRLARDAPPAAPPLPISDFPLTEAPIGTELRVVGFGNNDGVAGTGAGIKRQMRIPLQEVSSRHVIFGTRDRNTCQGDSGGPTFMLVDGIEKIIGVTSFGTVGCQGTSYMTRTDIMWESFMNEVLHAWGEACPHDGVCDEDCAAALPDPDCDPCGMNDVCAESCERPDYDCPTGALPTESCESDIDCETRLCLTAPEDDRIRYCSDTCDPNVDRKINGCPILLPICEDQGDGRGVCTYAGITAGAQGAFCQASDECRSGMCDTKDNICVEACGDGLPECAEGYVCRDLGSVDACALPNDDSCSVASGKTGGIWLLLALFALSRRRRRS